VAEKLISAGAKVEATTGDGALVHGAMGPWSHWDDNISSIIGNDSKLSSYYCNMV
jgi:hypothetical protein